MVARIAFHECRLHVVFEVMDSGKLALLHVSAAAFDESTVTNEQKAAFDVVGLNGTGVGRDEPHGPKYTFTMPRMHLRYKAHRDKGTGNALRMTVRFSKSDGQSEGAIMFPYRYRIGYRARTTCSVTRERGTVIS